MPTLVLLPGLDGTGNLFVPLQMALPPARRVRVVRYPRNELLDYVALTDLVERAVAGAGPLCVLGESFSGPIALNLAARLGEQVRGVVLVASFVENPTPLPGMAASLVRSFAVPARPPRALLKQFLIGNDAPPARVEELEAAIASVEPGVLAARVRALVALRRRDVTVPPGLPLLDVRGVHDQLVPRLAAGAVAASGARVEAVELDAPHLVAQRAPAALAKLIEEFITSLEPQRLPQLAPPEPSPA